MRKECTWLFCDSHYFFWSFIFHLSRASTHDLEFFLFFLLFLPLICIYCLQISEQIWLWQKIPAGQNMEFLFIRSWYKKCLTHFHFILHWCQWSRLLFIIRFWQFICRWWCWNAYKIREIYHKSLNDYKKNHLETTYILLPIWSIFLHCQWIN